MEMRSREIAESRGFTDAHRRLNNILAISLVAVVGLSPLPLASARPLFWAISAGVVASISATYWLVVLLAGWRLRFPLRRLAWEAALGTCLLAALLAQVLPLNGIFSIPRFEIPSVGVLTSDTLSLAPGATWLMLMRMMTYGLFFALTLQVGVNPDRARAMLVAIFAIIVAYAVLGLFLLTQLHDTIFGLKKWAYLGSATATFVNRNSYATFLAFGLTIGTVVLLQNLSGVDRGRDQKPGNGLFSAAALSTLVGLLFIGTALLATQSRMGLVVGVLGSALVAMLGGHRAGLSWRWFFGLAIAMILLGVVAASQFSGVVERIGSLEGSADDRLALYQQVIEMIRARPWLGYGGGSFELAYPLFHSAPVSADVVWDKAHSTYLQLWAELGLVAGSIPIVIVASAFLRAVIAFFQARADWQVGLAAIGVAVVGAVHSTVDFSLEIQAVTFVFLIVLALGVASQRGSHR